MFTVRTVYSEYEDDAHCNAWGARHFTTFDGKSFTFPGEWTYTLVQEYVTTRPPAYSVLINMAYDCTESVECKIAVQVCNSYNSFNDQTNCEVLTFQVPPELNSWTGDFIYLGKCDLLKKLLLDNKITF